MTTTQRPLVVMAYEELLALSHENLDCQQLREAVKRMGEVNQILLGHVDRMEQKRILFALAYQMKRPKSAPPPPEHQYGPDII